MTTRQRKFRTITIVTLSFFLMTCTTQTNKFNQELTINKSVYNYKSARLDSMINLLKEYNKNMFHGGSLDGTFWTNQTKMWYKFPNYMLKQEFAGYEFSKIKPNLILITHPAKDYFTAQVGYGYLDTTNNSTNAFCVYTFALKSEHDSLKLFPIIETYKFKSYENEFVTLKVKDTVTEYKYIFDSLNLYNLRLAKLFNTTPIKFMCYKFVDFAELNSCIGLDVQRNYSRNVNNAYCDAFNKIIYGTTFGCYFHESVHLYVGQQYSETVHVWIDEGLATYFGGSGLSLNKHLRYLSIDLKKHSEYNLNNFLDFESKFIDDITNDVYTNYKFTIGGLLCKIIYEKNGADGLKKLLSSGNTNEQLYKTVCELLNIKQTDLNTFLRQEINKYHIDTN